MQDIQASISGNSRESFGKLSGRSEKFVHGKRNLQQETIADIRIEQALQPLLLVGRNPFSINGQPKGIPDLKFRNSTEGDRLPQSLDLDSGRFGICIS